MNEKVQEILASLTLEEKASLCSGADFWHLKSIQRLGVPAIMVTDGPHGLRKQGSASNNLSLSQTVPATCFPTASATASSWDPDLMQDIGRALGEECLQEDVAVILGPGANIKRSPLCGRNFEYVSEDPYLTAEMTAGLIQGVQSQGVGTSLKHYAVNNQETRRMTINALVDERSLREIYLPGFEGAVKQAQPWTVMCSYNRLNGTYASEYECLLTGILRDEWGFKGLVMTDWGACNNRVDGLIAGQDLEMPASGGINDSKIVEAVQNGSLEIAVLDRAVERLLTLIFTTTENQKTGYPYDVDAHHALARRAAGESAVLLKNDAGILPLKEDARIAVIGAFAKTPRYQGSGSSLMNPSRLDHAHAEIAKVVPNFSYAAGYVPDSDIPDETLIAEACTAAKEAEIVLLFAGLPDTYETEGIDRDHLRMPDSHNQLIQRVAAANPNTVVILSNGAPVEMPWAGSVKAILEGYLGGQAGAGGMVDVLFGKVNPSGKLAETFPLHLADVPSSQNFPAGPKTVEYREGIYVGYRYFDTANRPVLYPFGYGLSYTSFSYSGLDISSERINQGDNLTVSLTVKNTGSTAGAEVIQLYVSDMKSTIFRPAKELKRFAKVFLQPGEEKLVEFTLDARCFAYYNVEIADWHIESGVFELLAGASSADIRARAAVWVESSRPEVQVPDLRKTAPAYYNLASAPLVVDDASFRALYGPEIPANQTLPGEQFDLTTPLGDLRSTLVGRQLFKTVRDNFRKTMAADATETTRKMIDQMVVDIPLRSMIAFSQGQFSEAMVNGLLKMMNGKPFQGLVDLVKTMLQRK